MTGHGFATDAWPRLYERVMAADILVLAGPIWLGGDSSVAERVIERLWACSSLLDDKGRYACYGRVGGCLITGNEDGVRHCAVSVLDLQRFGYTFPTRAAAGCRGLPRAGSARRDRDRGTWARIRAARRTTSPTATPPS